MSSAEERLCSRKSVQGTLCELWSQGLFNHRKGVLCVSAHDFSMEDLEQHPWLHFSIWAVVMNSLPLSHPPSHKPLELSGKSPKPRLMTSLLSDLEQPFSPIPPSVQWRRIISPPRTALIRRMNLKFFELPGRSPKLMVTHGGL